MKKFRITETLSMEVEAESMYEVTTKYYNDEFVLDSNNFIGAYIEEIDIDTNNIPILNITHVTEVLSILTYSWKDINYEYDKLTDKEKECISKETFNYIKDYL